MKVKVKVLRRLWRKCRWIVCLLLILLAFFLVARYVSGGVSNRTILEVVLTEADAIREKVDSRADGLSAKLDAIDRRLEAVDRRLESVDGKLDRLLRLADQPMPDGLRKAD